MFLLLVPVWVAGADTITPARSADAARARWQLDWRPNETTPPRRVVALRFNYVANERCVPWLECVRSAGLLPSLGLTPWPRGTKVLFVGNSYVRQLAQTAILDAPEGEIESMFLPVADNVTDANRACICPLTRDQAGEFGVSCRPQQEVMASARSSRPVLRVVDGVQYCDGYLHASGDSTPSASICVDDAALVRLYGGGVIAQIINHPAMLLPLDEAVLKLFGIPLGAFDAVVANAGHTAIFYRKPCGMQASDVRDALGKDNDVSTVRQVRSLINAGFTGHLFNVATKMWTGKPAGNGTHVGNISIGSLPFRVHASNVLHKNSHAVTRKCGAARAASDHACYPGPTLWMMEALRAQYVKLHAATGSR